MLKIQTLNKIDQEGLQGFPHAKYEIGNDFQDPDAILLRSFSMHDMELPDSLKAVARAGAGVNNIPIDRCTDKGIVVFNTPGANANAVKELVIAGMLLSSRDIAGGIAWAQTLKPEGDKVPALVEKGKAAFGGIELKGKTLAIIGLGDIGVLVANVAQSLGMKVIGFDPFITVDHAWKLDQSIVRSETIEGSLAQADFITLHVPLMDATRNLINADKISMMKDGVRILNFARGELVSNPDLIAGIERKKVACYVTDFPDAGLLGVPGVIPIPHLGASTNESEVNCAIMAANQLMDFLENGNIRNSVNFPKAVMDRSNSVRLIIANRNIPNMVSQITTILAQDHINISNMLNRNKNEVAYNIIDTDCCNMPEHVRDKIAAIEGVLMARILPGK
ncbi:MAG: phosphoglycerate dehydrogenase [Marinilabiliales bacterium]|nr:phosphoglycerate dehydrogenase [Marinilabiliales bacterium]